MQQGINSYLRTQNGIVNTIIDTDTGITFNSGTVGNAFQIPAGTWRIEVETKDASNSTQFLPNQWRFNATFDTGDSNSSQLDFKNSRHAFPSGTTRVNRIERIFTFSAPVEANAFYTGTNGQSPGDVIVRFERLDTTGAGWWTGSGATTLDELTDTNLTSQGTGSLLYFDGAEWIDLDVGTTGQKLVVGTGWVLSWETDSTSSVDLHRFNVDLSVDQVLGNAAEDVLFDVVIFDTASGFNNVTGEYTIPTTGLWQFGGMLSLKDNDTTEWDTPDPQNIRLMRNGATLDAVRIEAETEEDDGASNVTISTLDTLTAGDVIKINLAASTTSISIDETSGWWGRQVPTTAWVGTGWSGTGATTLDELTDTNLTAQGTGSTLYFDGTEWIDLDVGTPGQKLVAGTGWVLSWETDSTTSVTLAKLHVPMGSTFTTTSANNAYQTVEFGAAEKDTESAWDNATDTYTIAKAGDYWIDFNGSWNNNGSSSNDPMDIAVRVNGIDELFVRHDVSDQINSGWNLIQWVSGLLLDLSIGDEITIELFDADDIINILGPQSHLSLIQLPDTAWVGVGWGATDLSGLTDTDTTGSATGSILYNDGSQWIDLDVGTQWQKLVAGTGWILTWETDSTTSVVLDWAVLTNSSPTASTVSDSGQDLFPLNTVHASAPSSNISVSSNKFSLEANKRYLITVAMRTTAGENVLFYDFTNSQRLYPANGVNNGAEVSGAGGTFQMTVQPTNNIEVGVVTGTSGAASLAGQGIVINVAEQPTTAWVGVGGWSSTIYTNDGTIGAGRSVSLTDTLSFDGNTLVINGSSDTVAIGATPNSEANLTLGAIDAGDEGGQLTLLPSSGTGTSYGIDNFQNNLRILSGNASGISNSTRLVMSSGGLVGIGWLAGTSIPEATLDLDGTFQFTDGNQAVGRVLTSDADGNATWQAPGTWADGNGIVDADVTVGSGRTVGITNTLNFDGGTLFVDGTNNRVAVSAVNPLIDLAIGDNDTGLEQISDGELAVHTNNVERVRFDATGQVGIGTPVPGVRLDVLSQEDTGGAIVQFTNSSQANNTTKDVAIAFRGTDTAGTGKNAGVIKVEPEDSDYVNAGLAFDVRNTDTVTRAITINSDGNLGIGNFTPAIDLAVGDSDTGLEQAADGQIGVVSNGTEIVRFENATTILRQQTSGGEGWELQFDGSNGQGTYLIDNFNDGSGEDFRVVEGWTVRAYVTNGVPGWQTPSDKRLKDNIETLSVLDKLDAVRGTSYTIKDSGEIQIWVIAQEVRSVFPEAVVGDEDKGMLGVSYDAIAAIALQAVKELKDLVISLFDGLDSRVAELEAENAELKERLEAIEAKLAD